MHQLDRIIALEALERPPVQIDPDVPQRRRLALHDRTSPEMRLDIHSVRPLQRDDRLTESSRCLRAEIPHVPPPLSECGTYSTPSLSGQDPIATTIRPRVSGQLQGLAFDSGALALSGTEEVPKPHSGTEGHRVPDRLNGSFLLADTAKEQER